jgi:hypothetical protein
MYDGLRGHKMKVGGKQKYFPPTFIFNAGLILQRHF